MECRSIPTLPVEEIDYEYLSSAIQENIDTKVKGAVDNLARILRKYSNNIRYHGIDFISNVMAHYWQIQLLLRHIQVAFYLSYSS